jgi:hypothetical protein
MAHLILYSDKNFGGDHKHIVDTTESLQLFAGGECIADCEWPSSVSSIVILSGNWRFFAEENLHEPYDAILGPGLYPFVGSFKLRNDNIRSLELVDEPPNMQGEPLSSYLTLFENVNFRGNHVHVFGEQTDLDAPGFSGVTSSLMVELGNWSFFSDTQFDGSYPGAPVVGLGIYPDVSEIGIQNDSIRSLQPVDSPPTATNAVDNHVILFRYSFYYGAHRHVVAAEPNLNAADDDDFNDAVRSMSILAGSWWFYSDAGFSGLYLPDPLPPGDYPDIGQAGLRDDDMSSLQPAFTETVTNGDTILGEIILFRDANFGGPHKHVINAEQNLNAADDDDFNDAVSSFVILQGNWKFYRNAGFNDDYPAVLGPGLYPWVESVKIRNDDISSLQVVDEEPNIQAAPVTAHMALFEHAKFHGDHRHVFQEVDSFYALDGVPPPTQQSPQNQSFDNKASSMVVFIGGWQTFDGLSLSAPFAPILGPGLYSGLPNGIANDAISSVAPSETPPVDSGNPLLGHIILFENGALHGAHKHIFNAEPNLNADDDDSFNDETSSLVVYPNDAWQVKWRLYRDAGYQRQFNVLLGAGRFPDLTPTHIANDELSSLELAGKQYNFVGGVTVNIKSGTFPDLITHDVTMTFVFLSDTNALLLETPFEPFGGPSDSMISLVGAGTGTLLPDGTLMLPGVQIVVTVSLEVTSLVVADITFDLTTGSVMSPNGAFSDTGLPRDPATGAIKLVGAGNANDDDFLVVLDGTLNPQS